MAYLCFQPRKTAKWLLCLLTIALVTAGCGKRSANVQVAGRVAMAGKPLSEGRVLFQNNESGIALFANIQNDGTYRVKTYKDDGLPPGSYQVAIQPPSPIASQSPGKIILRPNMGGELHASPIPARYREVATSGLKITVQVSGNPSFDFDLKP